MRLLRIRGGVVEGVFRHYFEEGVVDEVPWIRSWRMCSLKSSVPGIFFK